MRRLASLNLATIIVVKSTSGYAFGGPLVPTVYRELTCISSSLANANAAYAVDAWSLERTRFRGGEELALNMRAAAPAFLNLFHVSSSCKATQLAANKRVAAGETALVPSDGLRATIKPPNGQESYILIATANPLDWRTSSHTLAGGAAVSLDMTLQESVSRPNQSLARLAPNSWNTKTMAVSIIAN